VRPFSRVSWLTQRIALATAVLALGGVLAGLSTWVGAAREHADVPLSSMFDAGLNVAVPALLIFGVGVLALAVVPRMVSVVTYAVLVCSCWWRSWQCRDGEPLDSRPLGLSPDGRGTRRRGQLERQRRDDRTRRRGRGLGVLRFNRRDVKANDPPRCSVHGVARVASFREFAPVIGQREQDDQCRNAHDRGSDQERFVHP